MKGLYDKIDAFSIVISKRKYSLLFANLVFLGKYLDNRANNELKRSLYSHLRLQFVSRIVIEIKWK